MSWSSEFEPDSTDRAQKGRPISFGQDEARAEQVVRSTQDLERNTLQLPVSKDASDRPSGAVVVATLVLAGIAMAGAILYLASVRPEDADDIETTVAEEAPPVEPTLALQKLVGGLDTTRVSFEPGTTNPTAAGQETLSTIRTSLSAEPDSSIAFEVRTFSQDNPAENHQLSKDQARAIRNYLLEGGTVDAGQVAARGLGSGDINGGGQLSHFLTVSLPEASRSVQNSIAQTSGFAFSSPAAEWGEAAPRSTALQSVATLLAAAQTTPVEISVHTFGEPLPHAHPPRGAEEVGLTSLPTLEVEPEAELLGAAIEEFLIAEGVNPAMLTITLSGPAPVQVPTGIANIISVNADDNASLSGSIAQVPDIRFVPGKAELEPGGQQSLNQVAQLLAPSSANVIIDVHTFSQQTAADNLQLSEAQALAAEKYLQAKGIPSERIRVIGSGNSSQFDESGSLTITVLSIAS